MRLLTHNFLKSSVRGTTKGYPLIIEPTEVLIEESPVNRELVTKMVPKLDRVALSQAVRQVAPHVVGKELPSDIATDLENVCLDKDDAMLATLHLVLFDIHVMEGNLVCPDTGRKFAIKEGIPNMVLHEDEILPLTSK